MARTDYFLMRQREAGYVEQSPDPTRACSGCELRVIEQQGSRCSKGGFFVRAGGSCRRFVSKQLEATA